MLITESGNLLVVKWVWVLLWTPPVLSIQIKQAAPSWSAVINFEGRLQTNGNDVFGNVTPGCVHQKFADESFAVASVAAGFKIIVLQMPDGSICTAGSNKYGALGFGNCNSVPASQLLLISGYISHSGGPNIFDCKKYMMHF